VYPPCTTSGKLQIEIHDPDQILWNLGAVGGVEGLLDSLKTAKIISSRSGGGWIVELDEANIIVGSDFVVREIGMK